MRVGGGECSGVLFPWLSSVEPSLSSPHPGNPRNATPLPPFLSPSLPPNLGGDGRRIRLEGAGEWGRGAGQGT